MLAIWEKGMYQGEMEDGFYPTLATYLLSGPRARGAVLVCPGGAYLGTSDREAEAVALQYNAAGYHAFVLYYSVVPRRHPQPLLDLSRSLTIIRTHAEEWHIDPERIAVCGFSAGGHLTASLGVFWKQPYLQEAPGIVPGFNRPNALILNYPVISSGPHGHQDSFTNLLGPDADEAKRHEFSLEHHVNADTPPTFLWHTFNDEPVPVENSLLFAQSLRKQQIPFELHIYPDGPHGLSLATAETATEVDAFINPHCASWNKLSIEWLGLVWQ